MSARLVQDVYEYSRSNGPARSLLVAMSHVADDGRQCWLPFGELARRVAVPRSTLYRARDELLELGEIRVASAGGGRGNRTAYELINLSGKRPGAGQYPGGESVPERDSIREGKRPGAGHATVPPCARPRKIARRDHENTPVRPPQGGQPLGDHLHEVGGASNGLAVQRLSEIVDRIRPELGDANVGMHLTPLTAALDGTVLILEGRTTGLAAERYGQQITTAAAELGLVVQFNRPPPTEVAAQDLARARGRRRQRRRAA